MTKKTLLAEQLSTKSYFFQLQTIFEEKIKILEKAFSNTLVDDSVPVTMAVVKKLFAVSRHVGCNIL